jgi:membrane-associated phospholipid phosphatase
VIGASAAVARAGGVPPAERSAFQAVNRMPESFYVPAYGLMQAGSLGSVFVAAAAARWRGRSRLALTAAVAGTGVWVGAKVVKRGIGRGRPAAELGGDDVVIVRGREQGDLGFPSGHAAVAFCLAKLAATELPPAHRWIVWVLASAVGAGRVYVGAHLPLDVVGGAALGTAAATFGARLVHVTT